MTPVPSLTRDQERAILRTAGETAARQRRRLKLTQQAVATALQVDKSVLSKFEQGHRFPQVVTLIRYCALMGLGMGDIFREFETILFGDSTYQQIRDYLPFTNEEAQQIILHILRLWHEGPPSCTPAMRA